MKTTTSTRWTGWVRAAVGVTFLSLAAPLSAPALAHGVGHHDDHRRHDRGHRVRHDHRARHGDRHVRRITAPRRIRATEIRAYRPYYRGRVYNAHHRHAHAVYYFPVETRFGIVYRPFDYCGGRLFVDGYLAYHGDHLSVAVGF